MKKLTPLSVLSLQFCVWTRVRKLLRILSHGRASLWFTSLQFLQSLLGCICIMFGILWFRAVERVRANVIERTTVARNVKAAMTALSTEVGLLTQARLVVLQAAVRRRQAIRLRRRLEAMEAYVMGSSIGTKRVFGKSVTTNQCLRCFHQRSSNASHCLHLLPD
jgi:hypothetical protein